MPYVQTTYLNLPVSDLSRSLAFYTSLGFVQNHFFSDSKSAMISLPIPEVFDKPHESPIKIMLMSHDFFKTFLPSSRSLADSKTTAQMLFCLSRESKEAVDDLLKKAEEGGAKIDIRGMTDAEKRMEEKGKMYGRVFEDVDGHIVEVVYMPLEYYEGKE